MAIFERASTEEGVRTLLDDIVAAVNLRGCEHMTANKVRLILEELLTNIRLHAYAGTVGQILVELLPQNTGGDAPIVLQIVDWGPEFNPMQGYVPPKPALDVQTSQIGGLGLHLVHSMKAVLDYERLQCASGCSAKNRLTVTIPIQE